MTAYAFLLWTIVTPTLVKSRIIVRHDKCHAVSFNKYSKNRVGHYGNFQHHFLRIDPITTSYFKLFVQQNTNLCHFVHLLARSYKS